jgi:adenylate cyclase
MPSPDNILPYLPRALIDSVFDTHATSATDATVLYADIMGFTAISRALAQSGKEGAEELTRILNHNLAAWVEKTEMYGGDVLLFGGDALMAAFKGKDHALRAARCGLDIQQHMAQSGSVETSQGVFTLGLHVGISSGELLLVRVGGRDRRHLLMRGELLASLCAAEEASGAGDVMLSDQTTRLLGENANVSPSPGSHHLHQLTDLSQETDIWTGSISEQSIEEEISYALLSYLPSQIRNRIDTGFQDGEHRPVAILFAGYQDGDALGDSQRLDTLFEAIDSSVEKFDGTLVRDDFTASGPRFLVLFGAPQALEDAAFQAVQCAQDLHEKTPDDIGLRTAISYGQVFAGEVGGNSRKEYTVIGDAINLAARLVERANPSEILVDSAVHERIHDQIDLETCDQLLAKGIETPVQTFRIVNVESAIAPPIGLPPLVGRDAEMTQMRAALHKAIGGNGQIVTVVGDAGIGKTRLVQELIEEARKANVRTLVGRCQIHSASRPYASWAEILESLLDIGGLSGDDRIDHIVSILENIEPRYGRWSPILSDALSFTISDSDLTRSIPPEQRQPRLFRIVSDLLVQVQQAPLGVVFEDAHWMDASSQELMLYLASQIGESPMLMVVSSRPGLDLNHYTAYAHHLSLDLEELDESDSFALFAQTMGLKGISDQLNDLVHDQAKGNPLFVQGVARSLLETGRVTRDVLTGKLQLDTTQPEWIVPDNLNELILSRLDRLSGPQRAILLEAAVIGSSFDVPMLRTIAAHSISEQDLRRELNALVGGGFLRVVKEGDGYEFAHALVQEVAYETLPYVRRRELQGVIAEELEHRHSGNPEAVYDQLAHHYLHSDRRDKARTYCERAGDRARDRFINKAAIDYYSTAIDLSQEADRASLHLKLAQIWNRVGEYKRCISDGETAARIAEAHHDFETCYNALNRIGHSHQHLGDMKAARTFAEKGILTAEKTNLTGLRIRAGFTLANLDMDQDDWKMAKDTFEDGLREARRLGDRQAIVMALFGLGRVARKEGKPHEAIPVWTQILEIRRENNEQDGVAGALSNLSVIEMTTGNYEAAYRHASESLEINKQLGLPLSVAHSLQRMVRLKKIKGDMAGAREDLIERLRIHREIGSKGGIAEALNNLGLIDLELGNVAEAMPRIIKAIEMEEEMGVLYSKANSMCNLGRGFRLDSDLESAETAYAEAHQILEEINNKQEALAESLTGLATIDIDRGHLAQVKSKLLSALDIAVNGTQAEEIVRAFTQFGRLAFAEGDLESAVIFLIQVDIQNRDTYTTWGPEVKEGHDLLGRIEKEMGVQAFEKVKQQAETMSMEEVVKSARE